MSLRIERQLTHSQPAKNYRPSYSLLTLATSSLSYPHIFYSAWPSILFLCKPCCVSCTWPQAAIRNLNNKAMESLHMQCGLSTTIFSVMSEISRHRSCYARFAMEYMASRRLHNAPNIYSYFTEEVINTLNAGRFVTRRAQRKRDRWWRGQSRDQVKVAIVTITPHSHQLVTNWHGPGPIDSTDPLGHWKLQDTLIQHVNNPSGSKFAILERNMASGRAPRRGKTS